MIYKRWQIAAILIAVLLGILTALPNVVGPDIVKYLPFKQQVLLGLDLKGGIYMQLQVDIAAAQKERAQALLESVRTALRQERVGYRDLNVSNDGRVTFTLTDANDRDKARSALRKAEPDTEVGGDGTRVTVGYTEQATVTRRSQVIDQSIEIVRRRVDQVGATEPTIQRQGEDRIIVQLPGMEDPDRVIELLGKTAKMNFQLVDVSASAEQVRVTGRIPPGDELLPADKASAGGDQSYLVQRQIAVGGETLTDAQPSFRDGRPVVTFRFDSTGARKFADITRNNVGRPFAIVLDGKVISAPVIREPILGGSGEISGNFTTQEAKDLALLLRSGALPAPLKVIEQRTVGPNLGADAIRIGVYACAIGGVMVIAFMLFFYRLFGVFASIGMIVNLALLFAGLSLLQASITLPGIVGILLTVGMSVDANVLINERIREEARKGRTPVSAIQHGFSRAMTTIIDANVTTLLKMFILYELGSGPVKGFAITISLGILTSMFTAITLVRLIIATWYKRARPRELNPSNRRLFGPRIVRDDTKVSFMKGRHAGLIVSAVLSIGSMILAFHPGLKYGIDFHGGIQVQAHMPDVADFAVLRSELDKLNLGPIELQQFGSPQDVSIRFERQPGDDTVQQAAASKVRTSLQETFPGTTIQSVEAVGATVSSELFRDGLTALGVALIAMLIYIWFRFEWQFGVAATVTLVLDVTKMVGFYALMGYFAHFQFNPTSIVAILTIMGYSINDKVVVYDRVRENLRLYRKMSLRELVDLSINETLSRTIATSVTVFLSILPLAIMSTGDISQFAIVLLTGIVIGTSSSIFIAAPILLLLGEGRIRPKTVTQPRQAESGAAG
ncbi:MAG TPA: protein translocase subunit SecD [Alphaproteobacteria bacterium]|nr:protein translocase subunit SecD [Alphaproteobacteria bacterium]